MTCEALIDALKVRPFRPFIIKDSAGGMVAVPHPEFVSIHPAEPRTVIVHKSTGGFHVLDLDLIVSLEFELLR